MVKFKVFAALLLSGLITTPSFSLDSNSSLKLQDCYQLTSDNCSSSPSWSPRGDRIAFFQNVTTTLNGTTIGSYLKTMRPDRSGVKVVGEPQIDKNGYKIEPDPSFGAKWSPDGTHLLYAKSHYIDPNGYAGNFVRGTFYITSGQGVSQISLGSSDFCWAQWSPSGRQIALLGEGEDEDSKSFLQIMNTATRNVTKTINTFGRRLAWSPNESKIVVAPDSSKQWQSIDLNTSALTPVKAPFKSPVQDLYWVKNQLLVQAAEEPADLSASLKARTHLGMYLAWLDFQGKSQNLTRNGGVINSSLSPDGRFVAFTRMLFLTSDNDEPFDATNSLWILDLNNGKECLVNSHVDPGSISWSPDGQKLVFSRDHNLWIARLQSILVNSYELLSPLDQAKMTTYENNLRQIGLAFRMYCVDNDGNYPSDEEWKDKITPYVKNNDVFMDNDRYPVAVHYINPGVNDKNIEDPASHVIAEILPYPWLKVELYADGHIKRCDVK